MVDPDKVVAVLLVDGWHEVDQKADPGFEVVTHGFLGAAADEPGFLMKESNSSKTLLTGGLSSIIAVRYSAHL